MNIYVCIINKGLKNVYITTIPSSQQKYNHLLILETTSFMFNVLWLSQMLRFFWIDSSNQISNNVFTWHLIVPALISPSIYNSFSSILKKKELGLEAWLDSGTLKNTAQIKNLHFL